MREQRRFIGLKLVCANAYVRCYQRRDGCAYEGRCPRCLQKVEFPVGSGGTDARFFSGDCRRG